MARPRFKSVLNPCGHRILVPSYQPAVSETDCLQCKNGVPVTRTAASGWKKGREAKKETKNA